MRRFILICSLLSAPAIWAAPTQLEINPAEAGAPYVADYSQAVAVSARLLNDAGDPVAGERVTFELHRVSDPDGRFVITDPVTAGDGVATARLTLVDGRHGGQSFAGAVPDANNPGEPYVITATFLGTANPEDCAGTDAGPGADAGPDLTLCPSTITGELFVAQEVPQLTLEPGNEVALGETITLLAQLIDPNGDAAVAGTDPDGDAAKEIEGATITFFYDLDGNARPSLDERLGTGETNGQGIATFDFPADPSFVTAENIEDGLHVQFGGNDRYALAGASQNLVVTPGAPDPSRTIVTVTPEASLANGFALIEVRATLVDAFNNTYGEDDEPHLVEFTADLGDLQDSAQRDPLDGTYVQELRAPRESGTAEIQVIVDGAAGSTATVEFEAEGCRCQGTSPGGGGVLLFAFLWLLRRRT